MMDKAEVATLVAVLEEQLRVTRELESLLPSCRSALVRGELDAIYADLALQASLCEKIRQIRIRWNDLPPAMSGDKSSLFTHPGVVAHFQGIDVSLSRAIREILADLAAAEARVFCLNVANSVLIKGQRRTFAMLANAAAISAPLYSNPTPAGTELQIRAQA